MKKVHLSSTGIEIEFPNHEGVFKKFVHSYFTSRISTYVLKRNGNHVVR